MGYGGRDKGIIPTYHHTMSNPRPSRHVKSPPLSRPLSYLIQALSSCHFLPLSQGPFYALGCYSLMRERLERTRAAAATLLCLPSLSLSLAAAATLLCLPGGDLRCTVQSYWSNRVRITGQTALELLVKPR